MIIVIDNYDSFTYNLVQELGELGAEILVFRNDEIDGEGVRVHGPTHLVISPGPGVPASSGNTMAIIRECAPLIPLLGVCLGHEALAEVYGGRIVRAGHLMHGKTSRIYHDGQGVFSGLANPFEATRYHSLIVEEESLPRELAVCAWTSQGEVMGLRHGAHRAVGVQFHPESILTVEGKKLLRNFLESRI